MNIYNTEINKINPNLILELRKLINPNIKFSSNSGKRGHQIESYICSKMTKIGFSGFKLNGSIGKDCQHFEIKTLLINQNGLPISNMSISNIKCDDNILFVDSNFCEKTKLILIVCIDRIDFSIKDIRFSNFTKFELELAYKGMNDIMKIKNNKKFCLRKTYFKSHTISINDIRIIKSESKKLTFLDHIKRLQKRSFSDWLKNI